MQYIVLKKYKVLSEPKTQKIHFQCFKSKKSWKKYFLCGHYFSKTPFSEG